MQRFPGRKEFSVTSEHLRENASKAVDEVT